MPNIIYFINRKTGELKSIFSDIGFSWHYMSNGQLIAFCTDKKVELLRLEGFERVSGKRYERYRKNLYWKLKRYFNKVGR